MIKIHQFIKENKKLILGLIFGSIIFGYSIYTYAATISSKDVLYTNTSSGLSSTNVQAAIDEVYTKTKSLNSSLNTLNSYRPKLICALTLGSSSWSSITSNSTYQNCLNSSIPESYIKERGVNKEVYCKVDILEQIIKKASEYNWNNCIKENTY